MRKKFDVATFCPGEIAEIAVGCYIERLGCDWPEFKKKLGLTEEEFIEAVRAEIYDMPNIKGTTIAMTIEGYNFTLEVRKDGIAILKRV